MILCCSPRFYGDEVVWRDTGAGHSMSVPDELAADKHALTLEDEGLPTDPFFVGLAGGDVANVHRGAVKPLVFAAKPITAPKVIHELLKVALHKSHAAGDRKHDCRVHGMV
jgi:hypothetical protein